MRQDGHTIYPIDWAEDPRTVLRDEWLQQGASAHRLDMYNVDGYLPLVPLVPRVSSTGSTPSGSPTSATGATAGSSQRRLLGPITAHTLVLRNGFAPAAAAAEALGATDSSLE